MERRGLVFLLLSGFVLVCHLQPDSFIRRFQLVNLRRTWTDAQCYCRDNFFDLATMQNSANYSEALQMTQEKQSWIGLSYKRNWTWSQDDNVQTGFTSWAMGEPSNMSCVTISGLGNWTTRNCDVQYYTMCYSVEYNKHILVKQLMTRSEAQTYCRSKYTDLSSIRTLEDNEEISNLLRNDSTGKGVDSAWIGLYRYFWTWSDRSSASYRWWANGQGSQGDCAMMESSDGWYARACDEKHVFLCEKAVSLSAKKWVKVQLSGGSANLNNPVLHDGILQQLKQKLKDGGITKNVSLRWRKQPNGKIFQRGGERPVVRGCEGLV